MIKLRGRFIGPDKIKEGRLIERKTYLGSEVYEITFINGSKREYPANMLDRIVTPKVGDLTTLQQLVVNPVVEKIWGILLDSEITTIDVDFIVQSVIPNTVQMNINNVYKNMWGKELHLLTVKDVEDKLRSTKDGESKEK